jgi:hypothetical protein
MPVPVAVMQVGVVRVPMRMGVRLARRIVRTVPMLVVLIVTVPMLVLHHFVSVFVVMSLREMEP